MVEFLFLGIGFAFLAPLVAMVFHSCYRSYKDYGFSSFPRLAQYAVCGFTKQGECLPTVPLALF